jgi:hypothetical protein
MNIIYNSKSILLQALFLEIALLGNFTVNALNLSKPFNYSEGIFFVKIKLLNGAKETHQLINKK